MTIVRVELSGCVRLLSNDPGAVAALATRHQLAPSFDGLGEHGTSVCVPLHYRDASEVRPVLDELLKTTELEIFAKFEGTLLVKVKTEADCAIVAAIAGTHQMGLRFTPPIANALPSVEITLDGEAWKLVGVLDELLPAAR